MLVRREHVGVSAAGQSWGMRQPVEEVVAVGEALFLLPASLSFTPPGS